VIAADGAADLVGVEGRSTTLIVCPKSLVAQWQREIERMRPALTVLMYEGKDRAKKASKWGVRRMAFLTPKDLRARRRHHNVRAPATGGPQRAKAVEKKC
jgi:SNF2 family DNA or RNA helicase